jgi:hypothetical protein
VPPPYRNTFERGDHTRLIPLPASRSSSGAPSAVPCTMVVFGENRQPSAVLTLQSLESSASALTSIPSATWTTYASVLPSPWFAHTPSAADALGNSVATCTRSSGRSFALWSMVRASEP